jgi:hypothetical protein
MQPSATKVEHQPGLDRCPGAAAKSHARFDEQAADRSIVQPPRGGDTGRPASDSSLPFVPFTRRR